MRFSRELSVQLSVVIPVRNEADNILPLLAEIHAALAGRGEFEVVYVDDGSIGRHAAAPRGGDARCTRACACCGTPRAAARARRC